MSLSARDPHFFVSPEKRETDRPKVRVQPQYCVEVGAALRIHRSAVAVVICMNHAPYLDSHFWIHQTSAIAAAEGASMRMSTVSESDCV